MDSTNAIAGFDLRRCSGWRFNCPPKIPPKSPPKLNFERAHVVQTLQVGFFLYRTLVFTHEFGGISGWKFNCHSGWYQHCPQACPKKLISDWKLVVVEILTIVFYNIFVVRIVHYKNMPIKCLIMKLSKFPPLPIFNQKSRSFDRPASSDEIAPAWTESGRKSGATKSESSSECSSCWPDWRRSVTVSSQPVRREWQKEGSWKQLRVEVHFAAAWE